MGVSEVDNFKLGFNGSSKNILIIHAVGSTAGSSDNDDLKKPLVCSACTQSFLES